MNKYRQLRFFDRKLRCGIRF